MFCVPILLLAFSSALGVKGGDTSGFDELSVRSIQFSSGHVERLPVAAIERLRSATPLPRPLTPESFITARKSLADISILTASVISDEAIDRLQGHFQRQIWGPGYVDVTDSLEHLTRRSLVPRVDVPTYPTPDPSTHPELQPMLAMVNSSELQSYVTHLSTKYSTRYFLDPNAYAPPEWIRSQFASWLGKSQTWLSENSFNQSNVVARIEASSSDPNAPIILLGAHLDSTSQTPLVEAPGADDDASGVAVIMAIMRILKANSYQGTYAIEAHAYAGEEGGLLGSQNLAKQYKAQNKTIRGMLNFEMVGYQPATSTSAGKSSTITVLSDPVPQMSTHMAQVVQKYVPTAEQRSVGCGYGCSDHYSFYDQGYPVVCVASYGPQDPELNPGYHSTNDTVDKLDFDKMSDFVRAGLAWVVEVAS
ncbi:bacterial leucyl aminopeptidase [Rhizoctonia solani AG-1 IB]|uniref:Peptide hydrolase n=1 Tax=Thanatephorus cucumeris (strain AG1-IB / isolate 7/3/14) TaxID=1108050 RepID=M5CH41_THACB|nr:bacterial leucyl aminopeptidase [Rhizoctonia solani AG-1 IB]